MNENHILIATNSLGHTANVFVPSVDAAKQQIALWESWGGPNNEVKKAFVYRNDPSELVLVATLRLP